MKKLLALALALVFILALTACGETKGSEEPAAGGAVSNIPNTDTSTTETEHTQPADTYTEHPMTVVEAKDIIEEDISIDPNLSITVPKDTIEIDKGLAIPLPESNLDENFLANN